MPNIQEFMQTVPLWLILLGSFVMVIFVVEAGYLVGRWRARSPTAEDAGQVNSLTGAHLALLAFMMGFTFNMAANHHTARKMIIVDEANAIGTAYLRADLVESGMGGRISALLADYVAVRAAISIPGSVPLEIIRESEVLQDRMWDELDTSDADVNLTMAERMLAESLNEVFDLHQDRVYASLRNRIPGSIWFALVLVTATSMSGLGYNFGVYGRRSPMATTVLAFSFAVVLYLISDLDRPGKGFMRPDNSTITQLNTRLHTDAAGTMD